MGLRITNEIIEATYELLRKTPPYKAWRLPDGDDIAFSVMRSPSDRGEFYVSAKGEPTIAINDNHHQTLHELMRTVAHEMIHLQEYRIGHRWDIKHGAFFHAAADKVCKAHNFDRGAF